MSNFRERGRHLFLIVSSENPLDNTYIPPHLRWDPVTRVWLDSETYEAFYLLTRQMQTEGMVAPTVLDGYRSFAYQKKRYTAYLKDQSYRRFATLYSPKPSYVMPPGQSEHQLATALDLRFSSANEQHWMCTYAADFGFIMRYPEDKVHLTGRLFDDAHYR